MATIFDADHLIKTDISADVKRYEDGDSIGERIKEWLETPEGTVADLPDWGHNLIGFKHDPQSPATEILIEMAIASKISLDIKDLVLLGVGVEYLDIDLFSVTIRHQYGGTVSQLLL